MSIRDHTLAVAKAHSAVSHLSIVTLSTQIYDDDSRLPTNRQILSSRISRLLSTALRPVPVFLDADRLWQVRNLLRQLAPHETSRNDQ